MDKDKIVLTDEQIKEKARQLRNKYNREHYKKNKEQRRQITKRYWERKAQNELKENKGEM